MTELIIKNVFEAEKGWYAVFEGRKEGSEARSRVLCWAFVELLDIPSEPATATRVPLIRVKTAVHGLIVDVTGKVESAETAMGIFRRYERNHGCR